MTWKHKKEANYLPKELISHDIKKHPRVSKKLLWQFFSIPAYCFLAKNLRFFWQKNANFCLVPNNFLIVYLRDLIRLKDRSLKITSSIHMMGSESIENFQNTRKARKVRFFETHRNMSTFPITFWAWVFQIPTFFTFLDIKLDWCVMQSQFFFTHVHIWITWTFRYLEHVPKTNKKLSTGLWKHVSIQNLDFCQNVLLQF